MSKVIVYLRVSTDKQETDNQKDGIILFCRKRGVEVTDWIEDVMSGTKDVKDRKIWPALQKLKNGDTLIVSEISRIGRNLFHIIDVLKHCLETGITVMTVKEGYILGNDIQSKVMAFAFGIAAEIERNMISMRTKEALARKKANGQKLGRPLGSRTSDCILDGKEEKIKALLDKGVSVSKIAQKLKCHRITVSDFCERKGLRDKRGKSHHQVSSYHLMRKLPPIDLSEAPGMYSEGKTLAEIATHYGLGITALSKRLKEQGLYDTIAEMHDLNRVEFPATGYRNR